jgi:hypothetical protein
VVERGRPRRWSVAVPAAITREASEPPGEDATISSVDSLRKRRRGTPPHQPARTPALQNDYSAMMAAADGAASSQFVCGLRLRIRYRQTSSP